MKPKKSDMFITKFMDDIISIKFYVAVAGSFFFYFGKLDQSSWITLMTALVGFHTANTVTSILKGVPPIISRGATAVTHLPRGSAVDNPDAK